MQHRRQRLGIALLIVFPLSLTLAGAADIAVEHARSDGPQFDGAELRLPADYREWIFLSSGLGMTYGPNAPAAGRPQSFTNVYVNPSSYRAFLKSGAWPDRTMFVLEIRGSASEGSINRFGHFQTEVRAIEANVKDARLPGGWGFFDFGTSRQSEKPLPQSASCYACHASNAAVEHTFVQFYPTLMEVAKKMNTVNAGYQERPAPRT